MYVVSTLNRDGSVSKKMFASFSYQPYGHTFVDKREAFAKRDEKLNSEFAHVRSGKWVVINSKTMKVVTR